MRRVNALLLGSALVCVARCGLIPPFDSSLLLSSSPSRCQSLLQPSVAVIQDPLEGELVRWGESVTLFCSVTSSPPTGITWYRNGKRLTNEELIGEEPVPNVQIGLTTHESRLHIPCFSPSHAGLYTCEADTQCGSTETSTASLMLDTSFKPKRCNPSEFPPVITQATVNRVELPQNSVRMICRAEGMPKPEIMWTRLDDEEDGKEISIENDVRFQRETNGDLIVLGQANSEVASIGLRCTARNIFGSTFVDSSILYAENA